MQRNLPRSKEQPGGTDDRRRDVLAEGDGSHAHVVLGIVGTEGDCDSAAPSTLQGRLQRISNPC